MSEPNPALGEALTEARKKRGLSRSQLSELSDVPVTSIWRYEKGQQTPGALALVKLLGAMETTATLNEKGVIIR